MKLCSYRSVQAFWGKLTVDEVKLIEDLMWQWSLDHSGLAKGKCIVWTGIYGPLPYVFTKSPVRKMIDEIEWPNAQFYP